MKVQAHAGYIGNGLANGGVVELHHEAHVLLEENSGVFVKGHVLSTGSVTSEIGSTSPATLILTLLPRILGIGHNVMESRLVTDVEFIRPDPTIPIQTDLNGNKLVS